MKKLALAGTALMLASLANGLAEARDDDAIGALADVIEANYYDEARAREIADALRSEAAAGAFGEAPSPDALASALTNRLHAEDRHFSVHDRHVIRTLVLDQLKTTTTVRSFIHPEAFALEQGTK